jgi:hypothetical protein
VDPFNSLFIADLIIFQGTAVLFLTVPRLAQPPGKRKATPAGRWRDLARARRRFAVCDLCRVIGT